MPRPRTPDIGPTSVRISPEAAMQQVTRLLRERAPESIEEVNAIMNELMSQPLEETTPVTPLDRAQELVYDAWEAPSAKRRIALAREALSISPDCADAYLVIVDETDNIAEAHALTVEALEAGRRAIGDQMEQLVADGAMWLALEARPYLRAIAMLATMEWQMGDRRPALERGWELLHLNPSDNQGMRYVQLIRLMHAGSLADIERMLAAYPDERSAAWTFGRALHLFRSRGPVAESNAALTTAKGVNRHVVPYLLGERALPVEPPEFIGFGDETEAGAYALDAFVLWDDAPGAIAWLASRRGTSGTPPKKKRR